MKKTGTAAKGHTSKHVGSSKHHAHTSKHHPKHHVKPHQHATHHVHVKGKHPHHGRGLAVGDWLPVCSLEAVAMSLRLAGQPVADDEVAWLWELCGSRELSIPEALAAAAEHGLGGRRPSVIHELDVPDRTVQQQPELGALHVGKVQRLDDVTVALLDRDAPGGAVLLDGHARDVGRGDAVSVLVHALILGVDVPGPHAVLATPDGWWSWGELWTPWTTAVSEAWVVRWE